MSAVAPIREHEARLVDEYALRAKLAKKLLRMQKLCGFVKNDKKGSDGPRTYGYASAEAVLLHVGQAMVKEGVAAAPSFEREALEQISRSGKNERLVTVSCSLQVIDASTGFFLTAKGLGANEDVASAQSASLKNTWMRLLNISTGDGPDPGAEVLCKCNQPAVEATVPGKRTGKPYRYRVCSKPEGDLSRCDFRERL